MIDLPCVKQGEDWDCGRACARAVLSLFNMTSSLAMLANPVQGMCPSTLEATIRSFGLPVASGHFRVEDLKHFTDSGRPVMCCIATHGGHWVVVQGVARGFVYYMDPLSGETKRVRAHDWVNQWRDTDSKGTAYIHWGIVCG